MPSTLSILENVGTSARIYFYLVCMCVCALYAHICVKACGPGSTFRGQGRRSTSRCLILHLVSLRQSFSLNLELDRPPVSPSGPPTSSPHHTMVTGTQSHLSFHMVLASKLRSSHLSSKHCYPPSHLSSSKSNVLM